MCGCAPIQSVSDRVYLLTSLDSQFSPAPTQPGARRSVLVSGTAAAGSVFATDSRFGSRSQSGISVSDREIFCADEIPAEILRTGTDSKSFH
ncbi:hypothetical protein BaRGS_00007946 [Batillaria attramentaria]|uniref:Uncharacterized protein n=1 Tax=Batillaria attramentaria TaxID=370345 RepID=A0ABD0LM83_9CAEN